MKKMMMNKSLPHILILATFFSGLFFYSFSADARYYGRYRRHRRHFRFRGRVFRPRFSISASGGFTMYNKEYEDEYGVYEEAAFSHGVIGTSAHLWIHPALSLDLGMDLHFITNHETKNSWSYLSFKPGVRVRFGVFYFRSALDFASCDKEKDPFLVGMLLGGGLRIPLGFRLRAFLELDFQYYFTSMTAIPLSGKFGLEYIF